MDGHPISVLIKNEESGLLELREEALKEVLLHPSVEDKHVCVLAIAGAFRKGKSFLLDFLLRYIHQQNDEDWLEDQDRPLTGFKWRQGSKRETTGVLIWSKPFLIKRKTDEVAVILMDTQGTFDTQSSMKDSTMVFALTTMVSSVLVYNIMNNIQEDDLMNLQLFTSYGMLAQEDCDSIHPFQKLHFLVRDWGFPYETSYGHQGGQKILDEILQFAAQASSQAALGAGKELYMDVMEALVGGDRPFLKTAQLDDEHEKTKEKAVKLYLEKNKYGRKNQTVVERYQNTLEEEIDKLYSKYVQQNEAKNVFKAARTPATLFSVLMFFYLMSGVFGLFGIYGLANICNLAMGVFLIMLTLWAYVRYSGEYREIGVHIDEVATLLWENVIHPLYEAHMEKHLKEAAEQAAHQAVSAHLSNGKVKNL